jgi:transposase
MARFKKYDYTQDRLLPIRFDRQILPCTFEFALAHIIDTDLDLSRFEQVYNNDHTGAPAYDPAILLKIILYAYFRGIFTSRKIA